VAAITDRPEDVAAINREYGGVVWVRAVTGHDIDQLREIVSLYHLDFRALADRAFETRRPSRYSETHDKRHDRPIWVMESGAFRMTWRPCRRPPHSGWSVGRTFQSTLRRMTWKSGARVDSETVTSAPAGRGVRDAQRAAAGPGGHMGATPDSSAADLNPMASSSGKSLPEPATFEERTAASSTA
jgi:hypothetical protein